MKDENNSPLKPQEDKLISEPKDMKDIKDYLHLYLGCEVQFGYMEKTGKLTGGDERYGWQVFNPRNPIAPYHFVDHKHIKLILRPLSDMTNDEAFDFLNVSPFYRNDCNVIVDKIFENSFIGIAYRVQYHRKGRYWNNLQSLSERLSPEHFQFILSKGFDLFGLIEAGLAIDKTKLNSQTNEK